MLSVGWADRGHVLNVEMPEAAEAGAARVLGAARLGCVKLSAPLLSVWVQLRGSGWIESREGRFRLQRGDWMVLERDSHPLVQTDPQGLFIGVAVGGEALEMLEALTDGGLYVGRGRMDLTQLRTVLRLWRQARSGDDDALSVRAFLMQFANLQREFATRIRRCPGRSRSRKRQVFGRMQRARLYLEGNSHRIVRITELAELTSFSSWYFSKAFQGLYDETAQSVAVRTRLDRAAGLLRSSSMMIGEVAAASGFDNCCSFARAFRAQFGMTASQYRNGSRPDAGKSAPAPRLLANAKP